MVLMTTVMVTMGKMKGGDVKGGEKIKPDFAQFYIMSAFICSAVRKLCGELTASLNLSEDSWFNPAK